VRVGNAAADQFQLDVYGYLLDITWLYHRHGDHITPTFWRLLAGAVEVVGRRWTEPDDGIWEVRGGRHFVASKVMAWMAVARELAPGGLVHRYLGADDGLPGGEASFCDLQLLAGRQPRPGRPAASCSATSPRPSATWG
jgi:hypothetical protein